ncbi:MAG: asparagine synthase (glutamine-hydrolyzing) [Bacteroidia bacterium]
MCGIVGFINCGTQTELVQAVKALHHRGPDGAGLEWFTEKGSGLGHTRLSIIDLSPKGSQPMYHKDSGNWITLNGEIYNYAEIRKQLEEAGYTFNSHTDTEVVLLAYDKWKEKCLELFNGMFAFCIYNENSGDTFIARDRLGIKPLYYWSRNNKLAFASEIKSLLQLQEYKREPDILAMQTPVHYQVRPFTGFRDIYKLPPGYYLKFTAKDGMFIKQYWDIVISENNLSEGEAVDQLDQLLNDSVRLNLVSDIPVGAMLSGGLDSSILCALMQLKMQQPLNTFTIKFEKKDLKLQGNTDDSYYAALMAKTFGFKHCEITLKPDITELLPKMVFSLDEPIADPAAINTYLISKTAKEQGISVLLNGMGADEVFGGYRSYLACLKADTYQKIVPAPIRSMIQKVAHGLPESNARKNYKYIRWVKRFVEVASLNQFERQVAIKNAGLRSDNFNQYYTEAFPIKNSYYYQLENATFNKSTGSYLTRMCLNDTKGYMTDHNLNYSDKSMMAAGVEGRPTLIDHRIVEFMFRQKPAMRINGNIQKYLLKKVSEKYIPKKIIYRSKAPFSAPMRGWLKNELSEMVNDILSYDTIKKRGIYNPAYVQDLISKNKKGIEDNSQMIWRLMVNEIWFRIFFK